MKKCPFCAEEIQDAAIKCRHCGSMLAAAAAVVDGPEGTDSETAEPVGFWAKAQAAAAKSQAAAKVREIEKKWGTINPVLVCPQCQTKGRVRILPTKRKKGISGAKATGAVLTLGWSLLATGLSRKELVTQAHCDSCSSTWDF